MERETRVVGDFWKGASVEALANLQGATPIRDLDALQAPLWRDDEEFEAFLAAVREWRDESAKPVE